MKKLKVTVSVLLFVFLSTSLYSQSAGDYRSAATGDWSSAGTWEVFDGAVWNAAVSAPTGSENITVDDAVTIDAAVSITGYVFVTTTGSVIDGAGTLTFDNGSTYEHSIDGGNIPTAMWNTGSTCLVTGVTGSAPGNSVQDFYNFTWNCSGQSSNVDVSWSGNTIGGNLTCVSTGGGSSQFRLTSSGDYTDSITINGDVILTDGNLTVTGSSTAMEYAIVVNGSINVTGGSFGLSRGSGGNATWYVGGDLSVSNAQVRSSNSDAKFLLFGDVTHTLNYNSVSYNGTINYELDTNDTLEVADGPDLVDLSINGTFLNWGEIITTGAVSFLNSSIYHHAINGGSIPVATWEAGSTLLVDGVINTMPGNRNQDFFNIVWDCAGQSGNYNMGFNEVTIGGDITINNTGTGRWYLCGPSSGDTVSVNVNGNITLTQGNFSSQGTGNGLSVVNVNLYGNIKATGGNFSVARGSQGGTGLTNFYLHGDSLTFSDVTTQNSNATGARFIFVGTNPQTLSFNNVTFGSGGCPVEIDSGSTLNVGESQFGNSGTFTLNAYGTLGCGNTGGLDGTLQNTGTTTLDPSANYIFNGTAAQITGTLLPATVNDLTVSNSAGVTLSGDVQTDGSLTLSDGDLDLNGNTITLGSSAILSETPGNTVTSTSGKITAIRDLNAPSGDNVGGLGAMITSSANLGSTVIERFHSAASGGGNEGIFRQYSISPTNNSGLDATLRFYYDESELNGISEDKLTLFKSSDGTSSWADNGGTVNTTDNYVELSGIGDFSYWTLGDVDNPVPVELISFNASVDGRVVMLKWITASELNNHGWEVERRNKVDEKNFNEWRLIGFVEGSGNSVEQVSYNFKDEMTSAGLNQYRLKQLDFDGSNEYSDIIEVESTLSSAPTEFALYQNYPNPFNPETVIEFQIPSNSMVNISVYNTLGEKVVTLLNEQLEQGYYTRSFDGSNLPSGIYIYRLTADNKMFTKKMMLIK